MKHILVPTDFSPPAEKAFRFAVDLAAKSKGAVILYHVFTPLENVFIDTEKTRKEYNARTEANELKRLQRLKKRVAGDSDEVTILTIVGRSPLIDNILCFTEHNHIDLIVMGTQGASGLKKVLIGSEAARIAGKSAIPVLLIPENYISEEPGKFAFATNYHPSDKRAITLVVAMAKLYKASLTVIHFLNSSSPEIEKDKERKDFDTYASDLQREFNESRMTFHLMETDSVAEAMESLDKKFPYDVMIMLRRKKSFLERFFTNSLTRNMAFITKKPLLIVPEEE